MSDFACAGQIDLDSIRRIWIPPTGKPYWVITGKPNAGPDLTDEEIRKYIPKFITSIAGEYNLD